MVVIFGAGKYGRLALEQYENEVAYFIDNNKQLQGTTIRNVPVRSVEDYLADEEKYPIVIASKQMDVMANQLKACGISDFKFYLGNAAGYLSSKEVVFNPYVDNPKRNVSEETYNKNMQQDLIRQTVNYRVEEMYSQEKLFGLVEIETVNRCNGNCDFCPVSVGKDTREYKLMTEDVFKKIIGDLEKIEYDGKLSLFSNDEPFLDPEIIDRHKYARQHLPNARMHLFTNGTLLKLEWFIEIIDYLDELIIDNYSSSLTLHKTSQAIVEYCEEHPELKEKVTIVLRNPHEILSSRGGDAPNRKEIMTYANDRCLLPFRAMTIRPDGKVSLCCCDPLGKNTLGDVSKDNIVDVWYNDRFKMVRKCLYEGRKNWEHCKNCDHFGLP